MFYKFIRKIIYHTVHNESLGLERISLASEILRVCYCQRLYYYEIIPVITISFTSFDLVGVETDLILSVFVPGLIVKIILFLYVNRNNNKLLRLESGQNY